MRFARWGLLLFTCVAACGCGDSPTPSTRPSLPDQPGTRADAGPYRLVLRRAAEQPSTRDPEKLALNLEFAFIDDAPPAPGPRSLFLENASTFRRALTADGTPITSDRDDLGWTSNSDNTVTVHDLPTERPTKRLVELELAVPLVKVTDWKTLKFPNLIIGQSGYLHCGPFELKTHGEERAFTVTAGEFADFNAEHDAYRQSMPLKFLHHGYAIGMTEITDADGKQLFMTSATMTGGATAGRFTYPTALFKLNGDQSAKPIAYPVTVRLRLPTKYETETATFRVKDIKIPTP
jgi:hypothetical protein